jgi:hypothetical protein
MSKTNKISDLIAGDSTHSAANMVSQHGTSLPAVPVLQQKTPVTSNKQPDTHTIAAPPPLQKQASRPAVTAFQQGNILQKLKINDDPRLEKEADDMGAKALQSIPAQNAGSISNNNNVSNVIQAAGWTHAKLLRKITEETDGVCNALTAAYIAGELEADASDDTTGVNTRIWKVIKALKDLLDESQRKLPGDTGIESRHLSMAFKPYLQNKGGAWLRGLPDADIDAEAQAFATWFVDPGAGGYKRPAKTVEVTFKALYGAMTAAVIRGHVSDMLEENFTLASAFDGVVSMRLYDARDRDINGHQLAIKHEPSADYSNNKFSIFDQSSGLATDVIRTDDEVIDLLTAHMRKYVTNPIPRTRAIQFSILISYQ